MTSKNIFSHIAIATTLHRYTQYTYYVKAQKGRDSAHIKKISCILDMGMDLSPFIPYKSPMRMSKSFSTYISVKRPKHVEEFSCQRDFFCGGESWRCGLIAGLI